ncbi:MAG: endolytic transglycosylase MltG [Fusobacteriaceae bacterium]|nr:endolytic transglycosylase MltG [Fusobacteriaceae bacterium]
MKKVLRSLFIAIVAAVLCAGGWCYLALTEKKPYSTVLEIRGDAPLIRSLAPLPFARSLPFRLYLKALRNGGKGIKAGWYEISGEKSVIDIIDMLEKGMDRIFRLTIPEGRTVAEVVKQLEADGRIDRARFAEVLSKRGESFPYLTPGGNFEGYFYPETYYLTEKATEEIIIDTLLREFLKRFPPENYPDKEDFYRKLILASILEREARVADEKKLMASVFYNRIKKGMKLASDATVNFVFGYEKKRILYKDLEVDSPYNTYKYEGLPPAPICNPDAASVDAAFHPADTEFLFFVARGDGGHFFSKTYREHIRFQNEQRKANSSKK